MTNLLTNLRQLSAVELGYFADTALAANNIEGLRAFIYEVSRRLWERDHPVLPPLRIELVEDEWADVLELPSMLEGLQNGL